MDAHGEEKETTTNDCILALVIKDTKEAVWFRFIELQTAGVVNELYIDPMNSFTLIFLLFILEHVLVKVVLQMFVGVVDAELFKATKTKIRKINQSRM